MMMKNIPMGGSDDTDDKIMIGTSHIHIKIYFVLVMIMILWMMINDHMIIDHMMQWWSSKVIESILVSSGQALPVRAHPAPWLMSTKCIHNNRLSKLYTKNACKKGKGAEMYKMHQQHQPRLFWIVYKYNKVKTLKQFHQIIEQFWQLLPN